MRYFFLLLLYAIFLQIGYEHVLIEGKKIAHQIALVRSVGVVVEDRDVVLGLDVIVDQFREILLEEEMGRSNHDVGRILDIDELHIGLECLNVDVEQFVVLVVDIAVQKLDPAPLGVDVVTGAGDVFDRGTGTVLDEDLDAFDTGVGEIRKHEVDDAISA
jgi:hypothetical protein